MLTAKCPNRGDLSDYAVGRLPDEISDVIAVHIESCPECQAELATIDNIEDTFVAHLRQPAARDGYLEESECNEAVVRARAVLDRSASVVEGSVPSLLGKTLGEYQLLEELGSGGMGTVYKALHTKLDRVVALKVLMVSRVGDRRAVARFEREMKAVGKLDHRHIVRAHDAREIDGTPMLVMEYIEGLDLAEVVRRVGPMSVADACEAACQAALGLQYAHEHGLVHRDIKPSNMMLTTDGEIKILDLGLARFHIEQSAIDEMPDTGPATAGEMTGAGQAMGTSDYMAPEQICNSRDVDIRADIYSLGCTLYKLLSGRPPFSGPGCDEAVEKMTAHMQRPAPSIRQLNFDVPVELAAVVDRMMAKSPAARFACPADVAAALKPYAKGARLSACLALARRQASAAVSCESNGVALCAQHARAASVIAASSVRRRRTICAAAVALLLLGGLGWALTVTIRVEKDGKTTEATVADGNQAIVSADGKIETKPAENGLQATPMRDRHFVRVVIGEDRMTFEGRETTEKELSALLDKVPNRNQTVLEIGVTSRDLSIERCKEVRFGAWHLGFESICNIGECRLGSMGGPSQRVSDPLRATSLSPDSQAEKSSADVPMRDRYFVRIVVSPDKMTFEGQETTKDELRSLLERVPNRSQTTLEVAITSDDVSIRRVDEASSCAKDLGFECTSDVGKHPLGSKGPPSVRVADPTRSVTTVHPEKASQGGLLRERHFVTLVVGKSRMTFQGQETNWKELPALLEKVPNRAHTVLQIAASGEELTHAEWNDAMTWGRRYVRSLGYEYVSDVGEEPLGTKGRPTEMVAVVEDDKQ